MSENMTTLVENARSAIKILENYLFETDRERYTYNKEATLDMQTNIEEQIALGESEETISELKSIIADANQLYDLAQEHRVVITISDKHKYKVDILKKEALKEVIAEETEEETIDETQVMLNALEEDRVETEYPTQGIELEEAISTALDELNAIEESNNIEKVEEKEETEEIPSAFVFEPEAEVKTEEEPVEEKTNDENIDSDAIEAFLNGSMTTEEPKTDTVNPINAFVL